jgi:hypothetical protein
MAAMNDPTSVRRPTSVRQHNIVVSFEELRPDQYDPLMQYLRRHCPPGSLLKLRFVSVWFSVMSDIDAFRAMQLTIADRHRSESDRVKMRVYSIVNQAQSPVPVSRCPHCLGGAEPVKAEVRVRVHTLFPGKYSGLFEYVARYCPADSLVTLDIRALHVGEDAGESFAGMLRALGISRLRCNIECLKLVAKPKPIDRGRKRPDRDGEGPSFWRATGSVSRVLDMSEVKLGADEVAPAVRLVSRWFELDSDLAELAVKCWTGCKDDALGDLRKLLPSCRVYNSKHNPCGCEEDDDDDVECPLCMPHDFESDSECES